MGRGSLTGFLRRGRRGVGVPVVKLVVVTGVDGVAHLVTDEAMAAGRSAGRYRALCLAEVLAASLVTGERAYCQPCRRHWKATR